MFTFKKFTKLALENPGHVREILKKEQEKKEIVETDLNMEEFSLFDSKKLFSG